jgi:hypothetical protein
MAAVMVAVAGTAQAQVMNASRGDVAVGYSFNEGVHGDLGLTPRNGISIGASFRTKSDIDLVVDVLANHSDNGNLTAFSGGARLLHLTNHAEGSVFFQALLGVVHGPVESTLVDPMGRTELNVSNQVAMTGLNVDMSGGTDIHLLGNTYIRPQAGVRFCNFRSGMTVDVHVQVAFVIRTFGTRTK